MHPSLASFVYSGPCLVHLCLWISLNFFGLFLIVNFFSEVWTLIEINLLHSLLILLSVFWSLKLASMVFGRLSKVNLPFQAKQTHNTTGVVYTLHAPQSQADNSNSGCGAAHRSDWARGGGPCPTRRPSSDRKWLADVGCPAPSSQSPRCSAVWCCRTRTPPGSPGRGLQQDRGTLIKIVAQRHGRTSSRRYTNTGSVRAANWTFRLHPVLF